MKESNQEFKYKNEIILTATILVASLLAFISIRKFIIAGDLKINGFALLIFAILNYYLGVFFHEIGHLVFGLISGYKFVGFRLGNLVVYKEDGHLKIGKLHIHGSSAHAVLEPPLLVDNHYPSFLYHAGGFALNFAVVLIALLLINTQIAQGQIIFAFLLSLLLMNVLVVLTNGVPMKLNGIPNDGYNLLNMHKDTDSYLALYLTMRCAAFIADENNAVKDIPNEWFKDINEADFSKHYVANAVMYYYEQLLANQQLDEAYHVLIQLEPHLDKYDYVTTHRVKKELSFIRIIKDEHENFIYYLEQEDMIEDLKSARNSLTNQRILFAQEFLVNKDFDKALTHKQKAFELAEVHPLKNEATFELSLIEQIEKSL